MKEDLRKGIITALVLFSLQFVGRFLADNIFWSIYDFKFAISLAAIAVVCSYGLDKLIFTSGAVAPLRRVAPRASLFLKTSTIGMKLRNVMSGLFAVLSHLYFRLFRSRLFRISLLSLLIGLSMWSTITRGIPFFETLSGEPIRIVIAKIEGPEFRDAVGDNGLTKSIVGRVQNKLSGTITSQLVEAIYTYLPIRDSIEAVEVAGEVGMKKAE